MKELNNIGEMFLETSRKNASRPAFARKKGKEYETISYDRWMKEARELAAGLMNLGVQKGDRIGLFADNRYEWVLMSAAITLAGAADVPRGTDITHDEMKYIAEHSGMKVVVVENRYTLDKLRNAGLDLSRFQIICLSSGVAEEKDGLFSMESVQKMGQDYGSRFPKALQERMQSLKPKDLYSLIYTSGTTGSPKGVMLSHANLLSQIRGLPFTIDPTERILSILPVWHIFERTFELMTIACGACTYYSSVRSLREDLAAVRPTFMASAPRLWESIYSGILANVAKASTLRKALFRAALF
ncbi:MAG: AMP-binding protein, partial [Leptospiraceae bacterium]|nr:AMP-binding protein [Leptospiraceae bacterium]